MIGKSKFTGIEVLLLLSIVSGIFITARHIEAQGVPLQRVCQWGVFHSGRLFDWTTWKAVEFTDAGVLAEIRDLDVSDSTWLPDDQGYGHIYAPEDAILHWQVTIITSSGEHKIFAYTAESDPDYVYFAAEETGERTGTGRYDGVHGCWKGGTTGKSGAFRMHSDAWLSIVRDMQQLGGF